MQQLQLMMFPLLSVFNADEARQKMENRAEYKLIALISYVIYVPVTAATNDYFQGWDDTLYLSPDSMLSRYLDANMICTAN